MSFFDSVKKSLGINKEKASRRSDAEYAPYEQYEVTFTEEKLGIGISRYTGEMPHLQSRADGAEQSCPLVTSVDAKNSSHGANIYISGTPDTWIEP